MKTTYIKSIVLMVSVFLASSCKDLTEVNKNPNGVDPTSANPNLVLSTVLTETGKQLVSLNYDQIIGGLMQHTQKDGWSGDHNDYDWGQTNTWSGWYAILTNNQYVYDRAVELNFPLQQGVSLVMKSMVFGLITDLWGNAPYSHALKASLGGSENIFPAFDSQEDIYTGILADLDKANTLLSKSKAEYNSTIATPDVYYAGDPAKWRKLANSLALRYYMRISDKKPEVAKAGIEKIVGNATQYPIMNVAADDATMGFAGNSSADSWPANTRDDASESNYRRIKMCNTLVKAMLGVNDPRLGVWANKVQIPLVIDPTLPAKSDVIKNGKRYLSPDKVAGIPIDTNQNYVGLPVSLLSGASYNMSPTAAQGADNPHVSWLNTMYKAPKGDLLKARLMSAAEVHFILAEAAQKGWAAGDAETHYKAAIQASFTAWGLASSYAAYVAQPGVAYNKTQKQIIEQKWIASWTAASEAWFDYKRTGYPVLQTGPQGKRAVLPVRFYYMLDERNLNKANADDAINKLESTTYSAADGKNSAWSKPWVIQGAGKPW
ncbi:SusD/RagB family nutrient-binding outer membrane lipoprotein [Dyadobacter frigoris]|uniref:SusD/RagB family nutrient-binding outer membrane lipoprotein n=1 Tax=Dyadobacter frigoris TaxID=2576211 RepID=A0A4U6D847_9BACT|nr:SusD/RagB family nutrient-binding outer membrane lipoprotein [Dyadobacter frigoris]TKT93622.1 SusD/RagB family nutrient-binding outer membrane lipoprotein [Dyadobacter frigoris]